MLEIGEWKYVTGMNNFVMTCKYILNIVYIFEQVDLDRSTMHLKLDLAGVQTHDLQIIDSTFHVPEMLVLTTESSGNSWNSWQAP